MVHTLPNSVASKIRKTIDDVTENKNKLPGFVATVVGKDGKLIFSHASGTKGCNSKEPMTLDSVFWIASCTKMIGGIAALQLCEQGMLSLDDPEILEKVVPEIRNKRILKGMDKNGKNRYVDKTKGITLRMLLTHTGISTTLQIHIAKLTCKQLALGRYICGIKLIEGGTHQNDAGTHSSTKI